MQKIIVIDNPSKWDLILPDVRIVSAEEYINSNEFKHQKYYKVINLCGSYNYQSTGYYVSMLADARGQKVLPSTATMQDCKFHDIIRQDTIDFEEIIQSALAKTEGTDVEFGIYYGFTENPNLSKVGALLFNLFNMPLLKVKFQKKDKWQLKWLKPVNLKDLNSDETNQMVACLSVFLKGKKVANKSFNRKKYDLAILVNPEEANSPSDAKALQKFIKAADKIGFTTEMITKSDFGKISSFDALFIRETTNVNHHTFRFARKAEYEGLAVIDDPTSILKCTNKVYLQELMTENNVPMPKAHIVSKNQKVKPELDYPFIIKQPDGAFSIGVKKVSNREEYHLYLKEFFQTSDLAIIQEFMPTDFDWRIGILNGEPIYVCKYYMARNHWQIVDWKSKGGMGREGKSEAFPISEVPPTLIKVAQKATKVIGNGLYGVDIKQKGNKYYVIEVNDNPSIDAGVEDKVEKNLIYEKIMQHLMNTLTNQ